MRLKSIQNLQELDQAKIYEVLTETINNHWVLGSGLSQECILKAQNTLPEQLRNNFLDALVEYCVTEPEITPRTYGH